MAQWPYNTTAWQNLRRTTLAAEPFCRFCKQAGALTQATLVDHITPVREASDRAFDPGNLQSLCASCHSGTKQADERRGYSTAFGADGWPVDDRHPVYGGQTSKGHAK